MAQVTRSPYAPTRRGSANVFANSAAHAAAEYRRPISRCPYPSRRLANALSRHRQRDRPAHNEGERAQDDCVRAPPFRWRRWRTVLDGGRGRGRRRHRRASRRGPARGRRRARRSERRVECEDCARACGATGDAGGRESPAAAEANAGPIVMPRTTAACSRPSARVDLGPASTRSVVAACATGVVAAEARQHARRRHLTVPVAAAVIRLAAAAPAMQTSSTDRAPDAVAQPGQQRRADYLRRRKAARLRRAASSTRRSTAGRAAAC